MSYLTVFFTIEDPNTISHRCESDDDTWHGQCGKTVLKDGILETILSNGVKMETPSGGWDDLHSHHMDYVDSMMQGIELGAKLTGRAPKLGCSVDCKVCNPDRVH